MAVDGSTVLLSRPRPGRADDALLVPSEVDLWGAQGATRLGDTEAIVDDGRLRQAYGGDLDSRTAVWAETTSTDLDTSEWRIFASDRAGGSAWLVARAEEFSAARPLPIRVADTRPVVSGDRAYWHTSHAVGPRDFQPEVVSASLRGTDVRVEIDNAVLPQPVTGGVAALRLPKAGGSASPSVVLIRADGSVRTVADVVGAGTIVDFVASGTTFAIVTNEHGILTASLATQHAAQIEARDGGVISGVVMCGDTVTWTEIDGTGRGQSQYFYDGARREVDAVGVGGLIGLARCDADAIALNTQVGSTVTTTLSRINRRE